MELEQLNSFQATEFFHWIDGWEEFSSLEKELAYFLHREKLVASLPVLMTLVFLIYLNRQGWVTLNLSFWSDQSFPKFGSQEDKKHILFPPLDQWRRLIALEMERSNIISSSFSGFEERSSSVQTEALSWFVLKDDYLYIRKNYHYEHTILTKIQALSKKNHSSKSFESWVRKSMGREEIDCSVLATALAMKKQLLILAGGPGTGKTHTIFHIVKTLWEEGLSEDRFRTIQLLAPTGKAVARLRESFLKNLAILRSESSQEIDSSPEYHLEKIAHQTATVHRFLNHDPRRILNQGRVVFLYDTIIVDEASMLSLDLFYYLFNGLSSFTQLILVGDKDQLPPVDAGFLFSDLTRKATQFGYSESLGKLLKKNLLRNNLGDPASKPPHPFRDCIVFLNRNFRFSAESEIGQLATSLRNQESVELDRFDDEIKWVKNYEIGTLKNHWKQNFLPFFRRWFERVKVDNAFLKIKEHFHFLTNRMLLCSHRKGPMGLEKMNQQIEAWLFEEGLIPPSPLYPGKVVMITENDYELDLFNGEVGILLPFKGKLRFFFEFKHHQEGLSPQRLPHNEGYYATSVYKSQGSEFDEIMVLFPNHDYGSSLESDFSFLGRELLYTALTRAKKKVTFFINQSLVSQLINQGTDRHSRVSEDIWKVE